MTSSIDHYAPLPTESQLERLAAEFTPGGSVGHERRIEGGLGCTMDVLVTSDRDGHGAKAVLRRYGPWGKPGEHHPAPVEAHALQLAGRHGVPVPELLWADHAGVFEEPAILISYIDGEPWTKPVDNLDWADQLALGLVAVHRVPLGSADYEIIEHATPGGSDDGLNVPERIAPHPLGEALWDVVLARRSQLEPVDDCFLHADFWPGNTLWREGRLVAVVDWEQPAIGDPALDVAYSAMDMRYVGQDETADRFIATYRETTGEELVNLPYWTAIALCRPMPDIGVWHPSFIAFGHDMTLEQLRGRHAALIEQELARQ